MKKIKFTSFLIRRMVPIMTVVIVICALSSAFCSYAVDKRIQSDVDGIYYNFTSQLPDLSDYCQDNITAIDLGTTAFTETGFQEYTEAEEFHLVFAVSDATSNEIVSVGVPENSEHNSEINYLLTALKDDMLSFGFSKESLDAHFKNAVPTYDTDNRVLGSTYYFSLGESAYLFDCIYSYDFSKTSGYAVQIIWAVGLFIGIALSVILSLIAYNKYCTQYEIDEYRRNMTSALAHDLKTPLTAIMGYSENLKSNVHSEKRDYYADAVIENVRYMNEIITGTLELAKIEKQDTKMNKTAIDMVDLANELLAKYKADFEDRGISVSVSGNCTVKADRNLISRAVENLMSNAVKYTSDGGRVEIITDDKCFCISNSCAADLKGGTEDFCKVFGKADSSRSNRSGVGIGLAMVHNIVSLHKFRFEASASGGKFTVKIFL